MKKKLVAFTGAGISAESGIPTFRASDGLWEQHKVEDVATPGGWERDPELVLRFYNERRAQVKQCKPNKAHKLLVELEKDYDVSIVTQNIDDLHERAGSTNVIHVHGEILKSRSSNNPDLVYDIDGDDINIGDLCEEGHQLRPFVVFFEEDTPRMGDALNKCIEANIMVIIGTSLIVEPAASLPFMAPLGCEIYYIDPNASDTAFGGNMICIREVASEGMETLIDIMDC